ncbi:MAG: YggU family protein [Candidatus Diapherotrites archaeon]|nr:YggU family protein [Candidatus Diapherotrites archaeon]
MSCRIKICVTTNSKKFAIRGFDEWRNAWLVSVKEKAEKGKANKELISELSRLFGKEVRIISGKHSREKVIEIFDLDENEVVRILNKNAKC